jgi:aminodeoxyfutalosine synthase
MAGSKTPQEQTQATLERTIREAGREPMQRDSYYRPIRASQSPSLGVAAAV